MYQVEVKANLVRCRFPPSKGWRVHVDLDGMELARGGKHPPEKRHTVQSSVACLRELGVELGRRTLLRHVDVVAVNSNGDTWLVEVEGDSSRQPEQALYSVLGQILVSMSDSGASTHFAVAFPYTQTWKAQVEKIPANVLKSLHLTVFMVSPDGVQEHPPGGRKPSKPLGIY